MAMSENAQSKKATNLAKQFEKTHEKIQEAQDKINDPGTPDWERQELQQTVEDMTMKLDRLVKRQSTSEPPPQEPPAPEQPGVSTASSGSVSQSGPSPSKPEDKNK